MTNETTLRIERLMDAPIEAVFRAWTTADAIDTWYRDRPDDEVRIVELDVRVGGRYHIEFGPPGKRPTSKPVSTPRLTCRIGSS